MAGEQRVGVRPVRISADMLRMGMVIQVMPGDRPMRLDRVERSTHNGRACLVLHGVQQAQCGGVEPVEYYVGRDHTVQMFSSSGARK